MTDGAEDGGSADVLSQLRDEAATVQIRPGTLPTTGFLISVPQYSLAGRGVWSDAEILEWWRRVEHVCTDPKAWFTELGAIRALGMTLGLDSEPTVLYAGTWTDRETKWFDANLYIPRHLTVAGKLGLGDLHPPTTGSPSSFWHQKRRGCREPDALDVAFAVGRSLHQAAVWELDDQLPIGGRSWPVWY
ncbi:hypothetical protein [Actinoplanes aureus]|uniref:Uncharacterized protein n=1 Tax=Actinoplanes aureus TaxID=2792083 RepID=A0A931CQA6_9ACTN|nr:hypothetical protein [Actinoplanes aureus]MBG0569107.1 hypothetical protein [Actinoplanes aureus]MBG0569140.1 hypothetical protein [Actinoplanes aureus]